MARKKGNGAALAYGAVAAAVAVGIGLAMSKSDGGVVGTPGGAFGTPWDMLISLGGGGVASATVTGPVTNPASGVDGSSYVVRAQFIVADDAGTPFAPINAQVAVGPLNRGQTVNASVGPINVGVLGPNWSVQGTIFLDRSSPSPQANIDLEGPFLFIATGVASGMLGAWGMSVV